MNDDPDITEELEREKFEAQAVQDWSDEFDERCRERHELGAAKYGPTKFILVDTLEEAIQEVVDLANYARYTYIKLRATQTYLRWKDKYEARTDSAEEHADDDSDDGISTPTSSAS